MERPSSFVSGALDWNSGKTLVAHHTHSLDLKSQENARKYACEKFCDVGLRCEKIGVLSQDRAMRNGCDSDSRCGLALRCEHPRCQIASDVGRAMRTTKNKGLGVPNTGTTIASLQGGGQECTDSTPQIKNNIEKHLLGVPQMGV